MESKLEESVKVQEKLTQAVFSWEHCGNFTFEILLHFITSQFTLPHT
jgi:hypothetical protein